MAINSTHAETTMAVFYQVGATEGGTPIIRRKTLAKVKESATDDDIYAVAMALFNLLAYPVTEIRRNNSYTLTPE